MAAILLKRSDEARYKKLLSDLKNGSNISRDEYPITVAGAFDLLNRTSGQLDNSRNYGPRGQSGGARSNPDGTNFAQTGQSGNNDNGQGQSDPVQGTDGRSLPEIKCFNCNNRGHYSGQCPESDRRQGAGFMQLGTNLVQSEPDQNSQEGFSPINRDWILLDTCSTHNVS